MQKKPKRKWAAIGTLLAMSVANLLGIGEATAQEAALNTFSTPLKAFDEIEFRTGAGTKYEGSFLSELEMQEQEKALLRTEVRTGAEADVGVDLIFGARKTGKGTIEDPMPIYSVADLIAIGESQESLSKHYILMNNIDMRDYTEDHQWVPIGQEINEPFTGSLNGNHYALANLTYTQTEYGYGHMSLFDKMKGAVVKNVIAKGFEYQLGKKTGSVFAYEIEDTSFYDCVIMDNMLYSDQPLSGFVYYWRDSRLENCVVMNTTMKAGTMAAGVVAMGSDGTLKNCHVRSSTIEGTEMASGLVYEANFSVAIDGCSTSADTKIIGSREVSGILWDATNPKNGGKITDCINRAQLIIRNNGTTIREVEVAGILGKMSGESEDQTVVIERCVNTGDITISESIAEESDNKIRNAIGGIYGTNYPMYAEVIVKDCLNTGKITIQSEIAPDVEKDVRYFIGGIGYLLYAPNEGTTISNCISTGTIDISQITNADVAVSVAGIAMGNGRVKDSVFAGSFVNGLQPFMGDLIACAPTNWYHSHAVSAAGQNHYVDPLGLGSAYGTEISNADACASAIYDTANFDMENVWVQNPGEIPHLRWQDTPVSIPVPEITGNTTYGYEAFFVGFDGTKPASAQLLDSKGAFLLNPDGGYKYLPANTTWDFYYETDALTKGTHVYKVEVMNRVENVATDSAQITVKAGDPKPEPDPNPDPDPDPIPGGPIQPLPPTNALYDFALQMKVYAIDDAPINAANVSQPEVTLGNAVTYHIRVDNKGTQPAIPARIVDKPHAGMKFEPSENPGWKLRADGLLELNSQEIIQPGTSKTYALKLRVNTNEEGLLVNRARIAYMTDANRNAVQDANSPVGEDLEGTVQNLDNFSVAVVLNRKNQGVVYDLFVEKWVQAVNGRATGYTGKEKTAEAPQVKKGDRIVYGIRVTNQGTAPAIAGKVMDRMPAGMEFDPENNEGWRLSKAGILERSVTDVLQPKESKVYTVSLTLATNEEGDYVNTAYIEGMTDSNGKTVINSNAQDGGKVDADRNNIAVVTTKAFEDMYKTGESLPVSLLMGSALLAGVAALSIIQHRKRRNRADSL